MKPNRSVLRRASLLLSLAFLLHLPVRAQDPDKPPEGIDSGNYNIRQTVEFGGRIIPRGDFKDSRGTREVYNTFVNLRSGPRLLDYTLEMRSLNHRGTLFDNLFVTNFGYGGDPNNVTRLRAYKNKWYNFSATFRRDYNVWDYNLLANPLNASSPTFANAPAGFVSTIFLSPHRMNLVRRMSDYNLIIAPQSPLRFRLGYSRNVSEGPSFSSIHTGTDALLFQPWKTTVNAYQIGVDLKFIPRTNISYDQFFNYYKGDTAWNLAGTPFLLQTPPPGPAVTPVPVDLGLPFNAAPGANQPCGTPFNAPPRAGTANPGCNGYLSYLRSGHVRTSFPTEQFSIQSNYFRNVDFSARFSYSGGDNNVFAFREDFAGLVTRTRQRAFGATGPASGRRVTASADAGITIHVSEKFRITDTFRFNNFRIPGVLAYTQSSLFGTSMLVAPNTFTPGPAPPPSCPTVTSPGCPQHNTSSPPDVFTQLSSLFLKQDVKVNTFELDYDFTHRIGARVGYRYRHRIIAESDTESGTFIFFPTLQNSRTPPPPLNVDDAGNPLTCPVANNRSDGSCVLSAFSSDGPTFTEINEHSALLGIWLRPIDELRISLDTEILSADNTFTRISPRNLQHYKVRASYRPVNWASFGAVVNILESRNNISQVNNLQHNRSYGFDLALEPNDRMSFDIGYEYNDIFSTILVCFVSSSSPPGLSKCPGSTVLLAQNSVYTNKAHYGYVDLMWKPIKRVTTHLGYAITSATGSTLILNPNTPPGSLAFNYHRPYGGFAVELAKGLTWKANWTYYGYNEKEQLVPVDATGPRDFRGNMVTLALRYAF